MTTERDLGALLRRRAAEAPTGHAYTFLGPRGPERLAYAELDARAGAIATALRPRCAAGDRVLLLHPPGLAYVAAFFGCLYAGVVPVPAYPPLARRWAARVRAIAADARPTLALTDHATRTALAAAPDGPPLGPLPVLATDDPADVPPGPGDGVAAAPDPGAPAFLQYTSGSTGDPKGVVVTHASLRANLGLIHAAFGHGPDSVALVWLPPYHDMGLVGGILSPLFGGYPGVLMPPAAFLRHPLAWLRAIDAHGGTTSGGPDFAFDLCARKLRPEALAGLDLSRWRVAFNGAEPVRAATLARFATAFAPYGFRAEAFTPCYGLAEATLIVTSAAPAAPPVVTGGRVSSGRVLGGQDLLIVDPETARPLPDGEVGEIWLAGPSVAAGYWQRQDDAFAATTADGAGPYLRTGDLGSMRGGELFVTGRRKDLLIVDGTNHYPQDVEATAEAAHPVLRPGGAAAFAIDVEGREAVALAAEVEGCPAPEALGAAIAALRQAVSAEHGIGLAAVALLRAGGLPRTSSGKVRRHACAEALRDGRWPELARWGPARLT